MNLIDFISIVVIVVSSLLSFCKGFLQELSSIIIWITGIYIFYKYYHLFILFQKYIHNRFLKCFIPFIIFFVFLLMVKIFFSYFISTIIKNSGIFVLDKVLGIFFGIIRGILFLCILLFFLEFLTNFSHNRSFKNSLLIPYFNGCIRFIIKILLKQCYK